MSRWKVLKSQEVLKSGFFRLRVDQCELPDGRNMPRYYVMEFLDWVNVVPVTSSGQIVMVEQYRHGAGDVFLEIPGGGTHPDDGSNALLGGQRELREETGYESSEWINCGFHYPNPALQNNRMHTFLALDCRPVGPPELDPFEDLRVFEMPVREVYARLERGEFQHALISISLQAVAAQLRARGLL